MTHLSLVLIVLVLLIGFIAIFVTMYKITKDYFLFKKHTENYCEHQRQININQMKEIRDYYGQLNNFFEDRINLMDALMNVQDAIIEIKQYIEEQQENETNYHDNSNDADDSISICSERYS